MIISAFIPAYEVNRFDQRAEYNQETDTWKLKPPFSVDSSPYMNFFKKQL